MEILKLPADGPEDILAVRSASRALATALGLDEADQVRLATAVSEVGREILAMPGRVQVAFGVDRTVPAAATVSFDLDPRSAPAGWDRSPGLAAARRLIDRVMIDLEGVERPTGRRQRARVCLVKQVPTSRIAPTKAELLAALRAAVPASPLEELWNQNQQLADALAELRIRQQEALQLNAELEETNRGVMAMYSQLTEELEETNRGVVALYAELDDKSVQLQEASQAKTRFFTAVSHELRSPVNSVLGLARVLAEADSDPLTGEQRHQVALIESGAKDLLELVNQLLDLAKAEAGRIEPEIEPVDVSAVAGELRGSLRPLVDETRVALVVDVEPGLPAVHTDPTLLAQVLRNLLVNAVRFTEDGEVRLRIRRTEAAQHVECEVIDTGLGIDPALHDRVFEEFFQVRNALQARSKGSGLGLAHSRRLAMLLGGEISLTSEPGRGSTFRVTVPIHWNPAMADTVFAPPATPSPNRTVLVVDDDEGFRTALRGMLQGLSHQVTEAGNGAEALQALANQIPDVVFLDLRMPDIDGAEVLARMDENPLLRGVPVVIVTSVDLGLDVTANLGRAHALLSKADVTPATIQHVLSQIAPEDPP